MSHERSPSPAVTPPPGNPRFPLSDPLRALAVLAVITTHATYSRQAYVWWGSVIHELFTAVDIFFALSGFLLYRPFARARAAGEAMPSVRRYFRRRVLRIVPAYWVALTILTVLFGLHEVFSSRGWIYYGFLQSYLHRPSDTGLSPAWTLSVEASFYLLLPLIAFLPRYMGGVGARWVRHEVAMLGVITIGCLAIRTGAFYSIIPQLYGSLPWEVDFFVAGMGLAVASVALQGRGPRLSARMIALLFGLCWTVALGCFLLVTYVVIQPEVGSVPAIQTLGNHLLLLVGTVLVVAPVVFDREGALALGRVLRLPPLAGLGVISYGVYLWHQPLLNWMAPYIGRHPSLWLFGGLGTTAVLATVALTVPVAILSYHVVELPFLRRKEPRTAPSPA